jgi:hypothetical protein
MSKYDMINVQPNMQCKEYLNLLVSEVVCQSSPQQRTSLCSPLGLELIPLLTSPSHWITIPFPVTNCRWQPLISDHVTKLYNSYIVEELLPPLPLLQSQSHDRSHLTRYMSHQSFSGHPFFYTKASPLSI